MNAATRKFYDRVGEKYASWQEKHYLCFEDLFDEISWIQFSQFLPKDKKCKILDAGCGGGGWSLKLAKMGYGNLTLLDLSETNIAAAKKMFKKHGLLSHSSFIQADLEELGCLKNDSFDFIFCERDPLDYCVEKQDEAFSNLVRILRPKKVLTLSVGTVYSKKQMLLSEGRFEELFNLEETGLFETDEGIVRDFTTKRVKELFKKNGLKMLKIAGRLTISDRVKKERWQEIYNDTELLEKIRSLELRYQKSAELAEFSSHIFAAGKKLE